MRHIRSIHFITMALQRGPEKIVNTF